jgi:hypothetical protein
MIYYYRTDFFSFLQPHSRIILSHQDFFFGRRSVALTVLSKITSHSTSHITTG